VRHQCGLEHRHGAERPHLQRPRAPRLREAAAPGREVAARHGMDQDGARLLTTGSGSRARTAVGRCAFVLCVLTAPSAAGSSSRAALAPPHERIALIRGVECVGYGGGTLRCATELWVVGADGSGLTRVRKTTVPAYDLDVAWSPDGRRLAFIEVLDTLLTGDDVYTVGADGKGLRRPV